MSSYTLTTTSGTHPLYNLMWCWCGQDKWRVKNISAFLGFTCLGFYLKRCPAYSINGWEAVSLNFRFLKSRHWCRRPYSRICCCHQSCCRRRRFSTTVDVLPPSLTTTTTFTRDLPYANGCTRLLSHFKS